MALAWTIEIAVVDSEDDAFEAEIITPWGSLTVIALANLDGGTLRLDNLHIDGPGAAALGTARLRRIARQVLEQIDVDVLVIHGWRRETGANPGHWPREIRFSRHHRQAAPSGATGPEKGAADPDDP